MPLVVADTHAMVWYLMEPDRLSPRALVALEGAGESGVPISLSSISVVEVIYLVEKGRLPNSVLDRLDGVIEGEDAIFEVVPLDMAVARYIHLVPREIVPDMPDRIIAATALYLEVPLVSRDRRIHLSNLEVIW